MLDSIGRHVATQDSLVSQDQSFGDVSTFGFVGYSGVADSNGR